MPGVEFIYQHESISARVESDSNGLVTISLHNETHEFRQTDLGKDRTLLENSHGQLRCRSVRIKDRILVCVNGRTFDFAIPSADESGASTTHHAMKDACAPMPGTLIKLMVSSGDVVEEGQVLAILEAMKMEHQIRAPRAGKVDQTFGNVGQIIDAGAVVVSLLEES